MGMCVLIILVELMSPSVWAQSDPTSTFLLDFGSSDPEGAGLESGRYKSRPPSTRSPLPVSPVLQAPQPPPPKLAEEKPVEEVSKDEEQKPSNTPSESLDMNLMRPKEKVPTATSTVIDFQIGTSVQYNSSSSPSWYRRYNSPGLALNLEGVVWMTPEWGISGFFGQSLGERVSDSYQSVSYVGQTHQDMALGLHSRLGGRNRTSQGEFGAYYYERSRKVERQAKMQSDWETQGLLLRLKYTWQSPETQRGGYFDLQLYPRAHHRDSLASGKGLGKHHETYGGKIRVGRIVLMSDSNRLYWGLGGHVEQNRFTGEATVIEPDGTKTKGVYGIHSTVFIEFGLGWSQ
jgi:hypothetical protein